MGQARFDRLRAMLPPDATVVGLDEHTALILDLVAEAGRVMGKGAVTLLRGNEELRLEHGRTFPVRELGPFCRPAPMAGLPADVWNWVKEGRACVLPEPEPPAEVLALMEEREIARSRRDWAAADALRDRITGLGWQVIDTRNGPRLEPMQD